MIAKVLRWIDKKRLNIKITEPCSFLKTKRYYYLKQKLGFTAFEKIELSKVLIGQQSGIPLDNWIKKTKEYSRISVPISKSPYTKFLQSIIAKPDLLNNIDFIESTEYFKMMKHCLDHTGHYMSITSVDQLQKQTKYFFELYKNYNSIQGNVNNKKMEIGRSRFNELIKVKKILYSDCYEIVDGHHRSAIEFINGTKSINVEIIDETLTYLQKVILNSQQTFGIELYQPLNKLEVSNWGTIRNCADRYQMMKQFLKESNLSSGSYLDMPCSYGYFVENMKSIGWHAEGKDIDQSSIQVAHEINMLTSEVKKGDIIKYLETTKDRYDVVSCMSLIHHFAMGRIDYPYTKILNGLDKITNKVLFLDTGQNHEEQYIGELDLWDEDYIVEQVFKNTTFTKFKVLGKDSDDTGINKGKNGRSFIAFTR